MRFDRITVDPSVFGGKPCIRGLRFPVSRLLGLLASGETTESILEAYSYLEADDVTEALRYAASLVGGDESGPSGEGDGASTRLMVFIDAPYLMRALEEHHRGTLPDFASLMNFFTSGSRLVGVFYYTPHDTSQPEHRRLHVALGRLGYEVVVTGRDYGKTYGTADPVACIVFDLLAKSDEYDEAMLVGDDLELLPVLRHLVKEGKWIRLLSTRAQASREFEQIGAENLALESVLPSVH